MKAFTQYIKESLNDVCVHYLAGKYWEVQAFKTVEAARKFVRGLSDVKYYDITSGGNTSEEANLIEWAGEGGYWDNLCNNPVFQQTAREKKVAEKVLKKRVELK